MYIQLGAIHVYSGLGADAHVIPLESELALSAACAKRIVERCEAVGCLTSYIPQGNEDGSVPRGCLEVDQITFPQSSEAASLQLPEYVKRIVIEEYRHDNRS